MLLRLVLFGLLGCGVTVPVAPAWAQGSDRAALVGRVVDSSGAPVARAAVTASSPALLGTRETTTDGSGDYRISGLTPGVYRIEVLAPGFKPGVQAGVRLGADATLVIDVGLELASIAETVRVSAEPPVVDVTSAEAPVRFTQELLANLPTSRVLNAVLNLAPGVNVNVAMGGVQSANPLLVDGVDLTDVGTFLPFASFNYNWVEDVQIVGLGAGAEYGGFTGVLQKSRLKSGANRFSGLGEFRTTRPSWVDGNTSSLASSVQETFSRQSQRILDWSDSSLQAGGPIRRDRLWFFTGLQRSRNNVRPALYAGPSSTDTRDRRVLGKVDAALTGSTRASAFYEYDRHSVLGDGLGPFTPLEVTSTDRQPDHNWHTLVSWMRGNSTSIEASQGGSVGVLTFDPTPPATREGPAPHYDLATGLPSGNTGSFYDIGSARWSARATVTGFMRGHEVRAGVEHEWTRGTFTWGFPGGRQYVDLNGVPVRVNLFDGLDESSRVRRATIYAQDAWSLTERLTLQPGLRVSFNRGLVSQGPVLRTHPVSPRIGVAWDVSDDHRTAVRVHYGRYDDAVLTAQFGGAEAEPAVPIIQAAVVGADTFVETSRFASETRYRIDGEIRPASFDQWVAGIERQLWGATAVTVQYIRRDYRNLMGFVDRGSIYEPVPRVDPGPDNQLGTVDDGGTITVFRKTNPGSEAFVFTNPEGLYRRYDAWQLVGRKQYGGAWQAQASYTWSSTHGNAVNAARSNSGGPDVGVNGVSADPNRAINADGPMPFDFTHEVKVLGTWRIPFWGGFNASGVYQFHTGSAWGRAVQFTGIQFVTFGVRIEPRGTRRTPALNTLDLRLEKTFAVAGRGRLGVYADAFNVGNQGIPDPSARRPVVEFSGPFFGQPQFWLPPRTLQVGVRVSF